MSGTNDSKDKLREFDRIKCIAFREAMEAGAVFITAEWIAKKIDRSVNFVSTWWKKSYEECSSHYSHQGRPAKMSKMAQDVVLSSSNKQRKSNRKVALQIQKQCGEKVSEATVRRFRHKSGLKPFHVISKPLKTETNISDRLWLCNMLSEWDSADFLHLAPSDEFYVWSVRRPNTQNDRIWSFSIEDISEDQHYRELVQHPTCIGIFVLFTAKRLMWVIKEEGQTWSGDYFREEILTKKVFPFLKNPDNVLDPEEVTFLHDKAPCFRANKTQSLLKASGIDFWGKDVWPGNSPDLNPTENIGSIIKDEVEGLLLNESDHSHSTLLRVIETVLKDLEFKTPLFHDLLNSFPERVSAINKAEGKNIKKF